MKTSQDIRAEEAAAAAALLKRAQRQLAQVENPTELELAQAQARLMCLDDAARALESIEYEPVKLIGIKTPSIIVHVDLGLMEKWSAKKLGLSWGDGELSRCPVNLNVEFTSTTQPEVATPRRMAARDFCRMMEALPVIDYLRNRSRFSKCAAIKISALPVRFDYILGEPPVNRPDNARILVSFSNLNDGAWMKGVLYDRTNSNWQNGFLKGPVMSLAEASVKPALVPAGPA